MLGKKFTLISLCSLLLFLVTCNNPNDPDKEDPGTTVEAAEVYGAIQINLKENDQTTDFIAICKDGPMPQKIYDTVLTEGCLHLHVPTYPFCDACGSQALCIMDDSCAPYPSKISVGSMSVSGAANVDGETAFDVQEIVKRYSESMSYPPFNEGDIVTITVGGTDSVPSFTLQTPGVAPLVLLNEAPILCEDGQDIELKWTAPTKNINSKIQILIDISYHGGTKAQITGECDDDGSQIVSGAMLDQLKSYGIAGYPRVDMKRITKGTNAETHVEFTIESNLSVYLDIPGLVSCNGDGECPNGGTCIDRKCQ